MTDFLDKDYSIPTDSNYMKFVQGENRFRILSSPIIGMEYWITDPKDSKKRMPVRKHMGVNIPVSELEENPKTHKVDLPKHFWALSVFNYQDKRVQILEITQKGIQKAVLALTKSKGWGSPKDYDLVVSREGEGMDTEYMVMPQPKADVEDGILTLYKDMGIDLDQLFVGGDPFKPETITEEDMDKIARKVK